MRAVVFGQDLSPEVRRGLGESGRNWDHGKFWTVETFFLYTLLWDPFVLNRTRCAPVCCEAGAPIEDPVQSVFFFAQSAAAGDRPLVAGLLDQGGRVVLQHPAPELLDVIGAPRVADPRRPSLISLRERWDLGALSSRAYYYPDQQPFLRLTRDHGTVLTHIGGNPDLVISNRSAVWAGNALQAAASYTNMPGVLSQLLGDLACLFTQVMGHFTDQPLTDVESRRMIETFELRRDFHALGYAYLTVQELARCQDREAVGLPDIELQAVEAASALVAGEIDTAQQRLAQAFKSLERVNRTLQPVPAIFTDTLHGGELYPNIGYFEVDWPQHPADVLKTYLRWVKTRSYRFNVDLGATSVREMALRFPDLFAELKAAQDENRVEFVNGSCNQPYPPFHSLESQIRQFDVGVQVWRDVLGTSPRTYASQEFGFCPQMGAVLAQQGYQQAVIRVQNMGAAPTVSEEQIEWVAPSGDRLRSLPSHPGRSEVLTGFMYNNLHVLLFWQQHETPDFAVFTCLGDIAYHRHFREDLARVCHYAPVFGRFATFSDYFDETRDRPAPERRLAMRDFHCDASFINLEIWPFYEENTGNYNTNCARSLAATNQFAAAELLDAVARRCGARAVPNVDHDAHWEALGHYQGHGTYIVPYYPSGAFLGGFGSPMIDGRTAPPNVAEYVGPFSSRQVKDVTDSLMETSERQAAQLMQQRLQALAPAVMRGAGFMLYSFAPQRRQVVALSGAAGKAVYLGKQRLAAQDFEQDRLTLVDLPSYGYAAVDVRAKSDVQADVQDPVLVGQDYLENQSLRAEFDLATGTLLRLSCKATGLELLGPGSAGFSFPDQLQQRCVAVRQIAPGPLRGALEFDIELSVKGKNPCVVRNRVWLDTQQSVVDFETEVLSLPELKGNQWRNHLGVRFLLADPAAQMHTAHFNALEPHDGEQLCSLNVLLAQGRESRTAFLNAGNEFYLKQGSAITNILVVQNEDARRFRYAVGIASPNVLIQGRIWNQPVISTAIPANQGNGALRADERLGKRAASFISFDSPDVELLSCRLKDGQFRVRVANTSGRAIQTSINAFLPIARAELTALNGHHAVEQPVTDGQVTLSLRPWDIRQLQIELEGSAHSANEAAGSRAAKQRELIAAVSRATE